MTNKLERINTVYSKNNQLNRLSLRAQQLNQLNTVLQQMLPPQFQQHCYLANINENILVIHADSANYASLLRFQASTLCDAISKHLPQIVNKLDVRVRPLSSNSPEALSKISLPNSAAKALQQTADNMEESPLKTALTKLAKRQKP